MRFEKFLSLRLFEGLKHADIPEDNQNGTCFEDAMHYLMDKDGRGKNGLLLCHGLVTGQGAIRGVVYNHAWVEDGGTVIDETVPIKMDKRIYYAIGNIKEKTVFRYTFAEMQKKVAKFKTYGPWEPVLIKNKY